MADSSRVERLPPQSIEAEEAVLGALLIDPDAIIRVATILRPEDFYREKHGWLYDVDLCLHERREPIDFLTVCDELDRRGQLNEVGGPAFITSLINAVPTSVHVEHYAHIVERTATLRRLIDAAGQIAALGYQESDDVDEVVDHAEQILFGVSQRRIARDLVPIKQVLSDYYDHVEYLTRHRGEVIGIPTGFNDIDKLLGGMQRSDLIILAARPSVGKTSLALSIAHNAARKFKQRIALFSLEMSNEQVVQRLISSETRIDSQRLRRGDIAEDEWGRFIKATGDLSETMFFIDDTPGISALELRTKARRLHAEFGLDLVVVDYLQLMRGDTHSENRVQEVSYISRALKALARELNLPVLALSQLSRGVESRTDKVPILSDLRESGCLAGDTLVTLAESGLNVPIRKLEGKAGLSIWGLNQETLKFECVPVSRAFTTGVKPVFKLTTRLGRSIRATANHRFLTVEGWKRLDELQPDDLIALPRQLPSPLERSMTDAELALLGHLLGDGCTLPRHVIQYTTQERDLAETVATLAKEIFGDQVSPRISQERRWYQVYLTSTRHHTHSVRSAVTEWLAALGAFGLRSYEKFVPERVFGQSAGGIAIFLRHLWATDGSIQLVKGSAIRPIAYYASSSPRLAQDVQALLLRLGINAILKQHSQNGKGRDQYHVTITGKPDLERFASLVGAAGVQKQARLAEVSAYLQEHVANTNRDVLPHQVWRMYVVPAMQRIGMTSRQMQAGIDLAYCGTGLYKQNMGRERAARVAAVVQSRDLATLAESDLYWDGIARVEADGEEPVFDLTVPGHHNFVANNLIVHNSLEQDADVVIFIYREELYNENTERRNIADIIVAKHRNGPTGKVALYFQKELALFREAELRRTELDSL